MSQREGTLYVLEVARDEAEREPRRLVALRGGAELWARSEVGDERFADFTVHPSGELTLGLEHRAADRDAYELVRLRRDGSEIERQVLAAPSTIPDSDVAPGTPPPRFLMRGVLDRSVVRGWAPWLKLEARGEGLVIALLSYAERAGGPSDTEAVSAVLALDWSAGRYTERWAHLVDGRHSLIAVAWQYDEFLWLDAATRLLLAVGDDGSVVIGRTLGASRCDAVALNFGDLTAADCRRLRSLGSSHRYQPFAWTSWSASGARLGTHTLAPAGMEDFLVFDLALKPGALAVAGAAVRIGSSGAPDHFYEPPGDTSGTPLLPFDGYLATLDPSTGALTDEAFVDVDRGDLLSAVRWAPEGLVAAGATGWNRWHGGMSISRAADPLLVLYRTDGSPLAHRTLSVDDDTRHAHLLSLDTDGSTVWGAGAYDAPMTHSGDANRAQLALGGLTLELR